MSNFLRVKNHEYKSKSHLPLDESQEPDTTVTVTQNYLDAVTRYKDLDFIGYRAGLSTNAKQIVDHFSFITYQQSLVYIQFITKMLIENGLEIGDRTVIYSKNSPLWFFSDLSTMFAGGITAPVYDTLGIDNIVYCVNLVKAKAIFVSSEYLPNILASLSRLPSVKVIISLDDYEKNQLKQETKKVFAKLVGGVLTDDGSSMYSIASALSVKADQQNTQSVADDFDEETITKFEAIDALIDNDENLEVKLIKVLVPEQLTTDACKQALNYLVEQQKRVNATADTVAGVTFTSGTSGNPKAVILTNRNILMGMASLGRRFVPYHLSNNGIRSAYLSYLPLAHVFAHCVELGSLRRGHLIYYSTGNTRLLTKDIALAKPTLMYGVPRVYTKIYQGVMDKLAKQSFAARTAFSIAYSIKKAYIKITGSVEQMPIIDKIFGSIHNALGGQMEFMVSGSSALPNEVRDFLEICSGARITSGYGLTEGSSTGSYNYCNQHYNHPNQLGFAGEWVEAIAVDRSDDCEFSLKEHHVGELLLKGPHIAQGYVDGTWGKVKPLVDKNGYYATGDLIKVNDDGSMTFVRRLGLVVKLQQGEFVDLEAIENVLERSPLIIHCFIHAEASKPCVVALCTVDSKVLIEKIGQANVDLFKQGNQEAMNLVEQTIQEEGEKLVRASGLKGFNVPKAYYVELDTDWTANTEFFTPSMKKKHGPFSKMHKQEIDALWQIAQAREQHGSGTIQIKQTKRGLHCVSLIAAFIMILVAVVIAMK